MEGLDLVPVLVLKKILYNYLKNEGCNVKIINRSCFEVEVSFIPYNQRDEIIKIVTLDNILRYLVATSKHNISSI